MAAGRAKIAGLVLPEQVGGGPPPGRPIVDCAETGTDLLRRAPDRARSRTRP